jgi:hypothetical protein
MTRDPKAVLMDWVDDQVQLDARTKYILDKAARFADPHARGWVMVADIAERTNSSERTVQYALRRLEADGLIQRTGETKTLNEKSRFPRKVPIYQFAPGVEGIDPAASGARIAPERSLGCKGEPAGVQTVAPLKEPIGTDTPSDEGVERARQREALFERLEAAFPKRGLGFTNRNRAVEAFWRLLDEGLDVLDLIQAARSYASDRKGKAADQGLDYWLVDRKYRGWWPEAQLPMGGSSAGGAPNEAPGMATGDDQAVWRQVVERAEAEMGEAEFAYVVRCYLGRIGQQLHVVASATHGERYIRERMWKRVSTWWADADRAGRAVLLISKPQFVAAMAKEGN